MMFFVLNTLNYTTDALYLPCTFCALSVMKLNKMSSDGYNGHF